MGELKASVAYSGRIDERREFLRREATCEIPIPVPREKSRATDRHVLQAEAVEHARVGILELGEINILFDVLVLRTELGKAAEGMDGFIMGGREEAVGRLVGR